jgi:hypothetical protein
MRFIGEDLSELSGGSGRRAAGIIVAAHLAPAPVMLAIWAFGLLPIFDDLHWIPAWIAIAFGIVSVLGLIRWFGMWGTMATGLADHGEEYMETFSPGVGYGLGWLRWFMQIVAVFVVFILGLMTWTNVRAWHVFGTDELRALPDRAAAIPVPDDWTLTDTEATGFGLAEFVTWPEGREPHGVVEQTFEVPSAYTFDDLRQWLESPDWADDPDGDAFGAIEREGCKADQTRCDVRLIPPAGAQPEYFIRASLDEPSSDVDEAEVEVRLSYQKYVAPDWDVSQETVDRAMSIPVPSGWVRDSDVNAGTSNSGESITQFFAVPESTTQEDVEAWLTGPLWTAPETGEPFGEIEVEGCPDVGTEGSDPDYLCSAMVVRSDGSSGPIESLNASLEPDNRVQVNLERNG